MHFEIFLESEVVCFCKLIRGLNLRGRPCITLRFKEKRDSSYLLRSKLKTCEFIRIFRRWILWTTLNHGVPLKSEFWLKNSFTASCWCKKNNLKNSKVTFFIRLKCQFRTFRLFFLRTTGR
jgi:hypothetical protein